MSDSTRRFSGGFSLIETIAAIAVLLVVVLMIVQITDSAARSVTHGNRHMDSDTEARMIFNRLSADFSQMPKRPDLDFASFKQPAGVLPTRYRTASGDPVTTTPNLQPGNDRMAFYAESDGYFPGATKPPGGGKSPVSVVGYHVQLDPDSGTPGLARLGLGLGWERSGSGDWGGVAHLPQTLAAQWPDLFSQTSDFKTVGDQIFRIEYAYLLKPRGGRPARLSLIPWDNDPALVPPHTSVDGFRDVAAIVVTLAVLDQTSRKIVNNFDALIDAFPDATADASGNVENVAAAWNAIVSDPGFAQSVGVPQLAASAVRIYERYFPLDSHP